MDWARVALLLDVIHKSSAAGGPVAAYFGDQAWADLLAMKTEAEAPQPAQTPYIPTDFDKKVPPNV